MSEDSKKYRAEMRTKAYKLANQADLPVDASDWRREGFDATDKKPVDVKEGPLSKVGKGPCNPRAFRNGGVVARKNGGKTARVARAMGGQNQPQPLVGAALGNAVVPNSVVPQRGAVSGGTFFKRGGIAIKPSHKGMLHKELGVAEGKKIPEKKLEKAADSSNPAERKRAVFAENAKKWHHRAAGGSLMGGAMKRGDNVIINEDRSYPKRGTVGVITNDALSNEATPTGTGQYGVSVGGKHAGFYHRSVLKPVVPKAKGGEVVGNTDVTGTRPTGGRLARAGGGKTGKGKMNVNIIIAQKPDGAMGGGQSPPPPGMPPRPNMAPPPGAQISGPGMPPGGMPPGAQGGPPMGPPGGGAMPMRPPMPAGGGNMPPPSMMRKRGGKVPGYPIEDGAGGGEGRLEKIKAYGH